MTFVTLPFFLFVSALVVLYYIIPKKYRWIVLLTGSYVFYWFNSAWLVLVLFGTTMVTYIIAIWIQRINDREKLFLAEHSQELSREMKKARKEKSKKYARCVLLFGVIIDLGTLLFLKYFNFFAGNLNGVLDRLGAGRPLPMLDLLLPLGISFYTLQAISYMVDVYRGKTCADTNPAKFMLYMSFFPQIVQGPIPRHDRLARQLYEGHEYDYNRICHGIQLTLWGLFKKLVIAERLSVPANYLFTKYYQYTGPVLLFASALYGLQIYTDFSGGMDIARGVAQMFGIELDLNFVQPYFSSSIEEFWRRWHITMGSWMKDYVFYPLTLSKAFTNLSRKCRTVVGQYVGKRLPAFMAMFIVYFLVGFWHGPSWKYVVYGVWNGTFIMSGILLEGVYSKCREKAGINDKSFFWSSFRIIRTFMIVSYGRIFSGSGSLRSAIDMLRRSLMNMQDFSFLVSGTLLKTGLDNANWFALVAFIIVLFYVDFGHERSVSFREVIDRQPLVFRWIVYIAAILVILIFGIYGPEYNAASFIYAGF